MNLNSPDLYEELCVVDRADAEGRVADFGGKKVAVLPEAPKSQLFDMTGRPLSSAMSTLDLEGQVVLRVNVDDGNTPDVASITELVRAQLSQFDFGGPDLHVEVHSKPGAAIVEISRLQRPAPDLEAAAK